MTNLTMRRELRVAGTTLLFAGLTACGGSAREGNDTSDTSAMAMSSADSAAGMSGGTMAAGASTMANSTLDDTSVIYLIAAVDRGEAAAGRIASTKATQADVKAYARMMVQEHTGDLTKLRSLASSANITLPAEGSTGAGSAEGAAGGSSSGMTNGNGRGTAQSGDLQNGGSSNGAVMQLQQNMQQAMSQLQVATGADFDRQYMASQLAGHQQVLDVLKQNESRLQNSQIRAHVTAMTAAVEKHLERARQIQQKIGDSTATTTAR